MRITRLLTAVLVAASLTVLSACNTHAGGPRRVHEAAPKASMQAVPSVCKGLGSKDLGLCQELVRRQATHQELAAGASTDTPNGTALAKECRDQYQGEELTSCLSQPA